MAGQIREAIRVPLVITTKSSAALANKTNRPSGLMMGTPESALADAQKGAAAFLRESTWMGSAARQLPPTTIKVTPSNLRMTVVFINHHFGTVDRACSHMMSGLLGSLIPYGNDVE